MSHGQGVPRISLTEEPEEQDEDDAVPASEEVKDDKGDSIWSDTPTFSDQLWRFPETCRMGAPITAMFKLKDDIEINRLNTLMARTIPEGAPDIAIIPGLPPQWSEEEGSFVELVKYRKVQYKRLIKK